MDRREIAAELGTSLSNLKRAFRGERMAFHNWCVRQPDLVSAVSSFYGDHGNAKTAERFGLKPKQIEHIVYRYKAYRPRQIRWTDKQIIEATRMAGLVSPTAQAKYFKRPGAHSGAIRSLWLKRFGFGQGAVNGMTHDTAKHLVTIKARYIQPIGETRKGDPIQFRRLMLWVDMAQCLKPEVPPFMREAIRTLADFQCWLWRSDNPKPLILKMIRERET